LGSDRKNSIISSLSTPITQENHGLAEKTLNAADHKCKALIHHAAGVPVMFLHGYSYTSTIWQRLSITNLLIEKHIPFLALDMPYG
jgi:pimeloyl-ACP methyl ester carboxylesterase